MSESFIRLSLETSQTSTWQLGKKFLPLTDNAYRFLGLDATAAQSEINRTGDSILKEIKLDITRTRPTDLSWLGECKRTETGVRNAISKLSEPSQRQIERLFWFHTKEQIEPVRSADELLKKLSAIAENKNHIELQRDALLALALCYSFDSGIKHPELWSKAFKLWKYVSESESFWSGFARLDLDGDFEMVSSPSEIKALRYMTINLVLEQVEVIASKLLAQTNLNAAQRFFNVLHSAELQQNAMDIFENKMFAKYEEEFETICYDVFNRTTYGLNFNYKVKPYLKALCLLAGPNSSVTQRSLAIVAQHLFNVAFEQIEKDKKISYESKTNLIRAWRLAPCESFVESDIYNCALENKIENSLSEKTKENYYETAMKEFWDAPPSFGRQADLPQTVYYSDTGTSNSSTSGSDDSLSGCVGYVIMMVAFIVLATLCKGGKKNSYNYNNRYNYNYNYNSYNYNGVVTPPLATVSLASDITVEDLKLLKQSNAAIILDVRTPQEYKQGHIPGAISFPDAGQKPIPKYLKSTLKTIVIYDSGSNDDLRSNRLAKRLPDNEIFMMGTLTGGYTAWVEANEKVVKGTKKH